MQTKSGPNYGCLHVFLKCTIQVCVVGAKPFRIILFLVCFQNWEPFCSADSFDPPGSISGFWTNGMSRVLNISSGMPRGGFGDIAPNLLMARRLREVMPHSVRIRMVVETLSDQHVRILEPRYQGNPVNIDGVDFFSESELREVEKSADFGLVFSSANGLGLASSGVLQDVLRPPFLNAKNKLSFSEPISKSRHPIRGSGRSWRFLAGAGNFGFYIRPDASRRPAPLSREQVFLELADGGLPFPENALLAFGYSHFRDATQLYLNFMRELLRKSRFSRPVVIVVKYFPGLEVADFPSNVIVVTSQNRRMLLDESLIAHADFPIMVTGDTSLSLAIEYGKPAFLECPSWKRKSIPELIQVLANHSEYFQDSRNLNKLKRALTVWTFSERAERGGRGHTLHNPSLLVDLALDAQFFQSQSAAFLAAKASLSLLSRVPVFMERVEQGTMNHSPQGCSGTLALMAGTSL